MRGTLLMAVVLAGLLTAAGPLQAGLYSTEEAPNLQFGDCLSFRRAIGGLRGLASTDTEKTVAKGYTPPRLLVKKRVAELEAKARAGTLAMQERINLSAHYIRLGENNKAVVLLGDPEVRQSSYRFQALANLATANLNLREFDRAEANLDEAIDSWPKVWPGWTTQQLDWFLRVEKVQRRLVKIRQREAREPDPKRERLDPLFPNLMFRGPGGSYQAGLLDQRQWDHMPADAIRLMLQLVYWMPHDNRLYWMLAEVLNANGDAMSAFALMDELIGGPSGYTADELKAHRVVLMESKEFWDIIVREKARLYVEKARFALAPLHGMLPPGVGFVLEGAGWLQGIRHVDEHKTKAVLAPAETPDDTPRDAAKSSWTFDWRQIAVSFGAGAVIATLLSMQLRELRRRKQATEAAVKGKE